MIKNKSCTFFFFCKMKIRSLEGSKCPTTNLGHYLHSSLSQLLRPKLCTTDCSWPQTTRFTKTHIWVRHGSRVYDFIYMVFSLSSSRWCIELHFIIAQRAACFRGEFCNLKEKNGLNVSFNGFNTVLK